MMITITGRIIDQLTTSSGLRLEVRDAYVSLNKSVVNAFADLKG